MEALVGAPAVAFIGWHDSWTVGIASVDADHRKMMDLLNQMHRLIGVDGADAAQKAVAELVALTGTHFAAEEMLMQSHSYPEYAQHKLEHLKLTIQLDEFQRRIASGEATLTVPVMEYMRKWFTNHLIAYDQRYAVFLRDKGIC